VIGDCLLFFSGGITAAVVIFWGLRRLARYILGVT
jgi:hypothetical protein